MKKYILIASGLIFVAFSSGVFAAKYSLPSAEQGVSCQEGDSLKEAVAAFNSQFVGENANSVVIKGLIDKGEVRVRRLSDLTLATLNGKIVVCAIVSTK